MQQSVPHFIVPFVRKQLTERSKSYENQSDERLSFEEDFVRIVRYLEGEVPTSDRGESRWH